MSLYTFAASNLTTPADLRRRPAIDRGQLIRTLVLFAAIAIAMGLSVHVSGATGVGERPVAAEGLRP